MFGSGCPSDLASRVTILISSNDEIKTKTHADKDTIRAGEDTVRSGQDF